MHPGCPLVSALGLIIVMDQGGRLAKRLEGRFPPRTEGSAHRARRRWHRRETEGCGDGAESAGNTEVPVLGICDDASALRPRLPAGPPACLASPWGATNSCQAGGC